VISSVRLTAKKGGKSDAVVRFPRKVRAAILTVSDSVSKKTSRDVSGRILAEGLRGMGVAVVTRTVVPDDKVSIVKVLRKLAGSGVELILTTGGTGVGPRDVTPEAVSAVVTRRLPGVEHALLDYGQQRLRTAMLSRAVAGILDGTMIVSVPGSPRAASDALAVLFPTLLHAVPVMAGASHRK
jgi:molybdenum cofactor synthesis domain-containing protein